MDATLTKLKGSDRRSIGCANEVVETVLQRPALFHQIMRGLLHADPVKELSAAAAPRCKHAAVNAWRA